MHEYFIVWNVRVRSDFMLPRLDEGHTWINYGIYSVLNFFLENLRNKTSRWSRPFAAPASGEGLSMIAMSFTRLMELVEDGAGTSFVERMAFWGQMFGKIAGPNGAKRKGDPSAGRQRKAHPQGRVVAGGRDTTFKARLLEQYTQRACPSMCGGVRRVRG